MSAPDVMQERMLLSFYGDDYTGSSAVMEVLSFAGVPTVLFLEPPTDADLARFATCRAVGIAGIARSRTPDWMDAHLPAIFTTLRKLAAPIAHYKTCSTFDSAPDIGSIGRAIDLGAPVLGGTWHPLLVAAPALGRYQLFGNLFAATDRDVYRLDRHPTMARHPVTPMDEADVRRHLARQTARRIGLVDIRSLSAGRSGPALEACRAAGDEIVAIDLLDDESLAEAGRLMWENRGDRLFALGSQGVEYALVAHWRRIGMLPGPEDHFGVEDNSAGSVERIAVVSASCSPVTAAQIEVARQSGFAALPIDASFAVDGAGWEAELARTAEAGLAALRVGRSPMIFTACGPDDPAILRTRSTIASAGLLPETVHARIGAGLGHLLDRIMTEAGLLRGVVAGGDTSGHAAQALGIRALTALAPLAPGAPLCLIHGPTESAALRQIVLKGGQMGDPDFFQSVLRGTGAARPEPRRLRV